MDPLAELVKIPPQALGIGMYQHDVPEKTLASQLDETVARCVHQVRPQCLSVCLSVYLSVVQIYVLPCTYIYVILDPTHSKHCHFYSLSCPTLCVVSLYVCYIISLN